MLGRKMKHWLCSLLAIPFCTGILAVESARIRQAGGATPGFPAQLLEGAEKFNLAIDVFGDLRGNFGPCG
jgi:hypothetical protein